MSDVKDNIREYERRVKLMAAKGSASCDYPLPDYLGDVKKILKYTADAVPTDKYLGAKDASFLYQVCFRVMYLDSEDNLTEACFSTDFEHTERLERECIDAYADTKLEGVSIRLQGPRKICAKAQMTTEVYIIEALPLPSLESLAVYEKDLCCVNIHSTEYVECAEREFAERIASLADVSCEDTEVIKESAIAFVESALPEGGGICVKGYVIGSALIRYENSVIRVEKKLPFDQVVARDNISEGKASYYAKAFITDAKLTLNNEMGEDGSGDTCYCSAVLSYSLKCALRVNKNCEYELVRDAFAPGRANSGEYVDFSYDELVAEVNEKRKTACEIERPTGAIREIVECDAELKGLRVTAEGEEAVIAADVCYSAVVSLADGSGFAPVKHTAKVEERIKLPGIDALCRIECSVLPSDVSISFDNEKLYPSVVLYINVIAVRGHKDRVMTRLISEDCEACVSPGLTVYYPTKGDTVWSVAKSHSVAPSELMSLNSFTSGKNDECVENMKYILIAK